MAYVELHLHSCFSFLDGASHPVEMAAAAARLGHGTLALTDHDGLHGAMEHAQACKSLGIRPITGSELTLDDGSHLTLLCEDVTGYRNLCLLLTQSHAGTREWSESGTARRVKPASVSLEDMERHSQGLVCLSGCAREGTVGGRVERGEHAAAAAHARRLLAAFGPDRFRIELQRPFARNDRRRNRRLAQLAERLGVPTVATGNVHAHDRERVPLQDAFVAVRLGTTLDESEPWRRGNSSHVLASPEAMAERFAGGHEDAVEESGRLAERLAFDLTQDLGYRYPGAEDPTADPKLRELCHARVADRYSGRAAIDNARARLDKELDLIAGLGLSGFFLLHRDLLELAREVATEVRGASAARAVLPPGRGRGSSVSSIVCYLTGLSHIDPIENDLFLGRFLNEELSALPDIDLDFPRDIREKLIPRVHERYGHDRSGLVAAFATYHARSAIRDFGKALGIPGGEVERAARSAEPWGDSDVERHVSDAVGRRTESPRWRALMQLVADASHLPRHMTQHPGGMVISTQPLDRICPIQPAAMDGRQMVQWDKESCADAGFLKIDLLGLGMLSAVERCVDEIARVSGETIDLSRIPYDDKQVYSEIQAAETMGVFQIESRAQMQMLKRTLPESLDDLTVQVALVRPGPIQGGAVHPYIERRKALRADPSYKVPYEHPSLEAVLSDTLGAIVFQDQVIEVAMAFAGFTPGEAEGLRRAMSRKRSEEAMQAFADKFVAGAMARGAAQDVAERVYGQIVGFSGFGFPKAHSAAFGLLAYQSTWLRVHHPAPFLAALLNEQPMGFYPPDTLVHEAQRRRIAVLAPDIRRSTADCRVEDGGVRIGLGYVKGVSGDDVRAVVAERERGMFRTVEELASRCSTRIDSLERLAWAGALDGLVEDGRREALWRLGVAAPGVSVPEGTQLAMPVDVAAPALDELTPWDRLLADYGSTNMTLREHPIGLMRPSLGDDVFSSGDLLHARDGERVRVAGMVVARQRPATAKGITFMLLEDELGTINLIVPVPVYERCRLAVRAEPLLIADGKLEHREGTINILVSDVRRLERPDLPVGEVRSIEPRRAWSNDDSGDAQRDGDLRAVMPAAHSFGRR
jgi:error-prone DNA polymerase